MNTRINRRAIAAAAVLLLATAACGRDAVSPPEEPEIAAVRLTFNNGAQTVTIDEGQVNASVTLPAGSTSATVNSVALGDGGQPLTDVTGDDFELRITGRTFTRSGPFAGTISGLTAGANAVTVVYWHHEEAHGDFETPLSITIP